MLVIREPNPVKNVKRILCVVDPSDMEQTVIERAHSLATALAADIEFYAPYESSQLDAVAGGLAVSFDQYRDDVLELFQGQLDELAITTRKNGIEVSTHVEWVSNVADGVCTRADDTDADIVIKETCYHSAIARALTTNTDWQLIRHCKAALWLVRADTVFSSTPAIVACVDPQQTSGKSAHLDDTIIESAILIADALQGELQVLHVYQPLIEIGNAATWALKPNKLPVDKLRSRIRLHHKKAFDELCIAKKISTKQRHLLEGSVASTLPGFLTERSASLVVLGSVSRRNLKQLLIGQTAETILDHSPCDLLVVKAR